MMEVAPVYITDIIGEVVAATDAALRAKADSWLTLNNKHINYVYGGKSHIIQQLLTIKDGKYPMIALMLGIGQKEGITSGFEGEPIIKGIYIATLSDNKRLPAAKYRDNFKPILFPIYHEFKEQLARHKNIVEMHPDSILLEAWQYPADNTNETNTIFTDFLDIIGIDRVSITLQSYYSNDYIKSF